MVETPRGVVAIELPEGRGTLRVVEDGEELARAATEAFVAATTAAVAARGRAIVALSGGTTPKRMGELLTTEPFVSQVPWTQTHLFWGDERWVPISHDDSNAGTARRGFLDRLPVPPANVHPVPTVMRTPAEAANAYEAEIRRLTGVSTGVPVFDLILLGMGDDGHTASLFPRTDALAEHDRLVVANYVPKLAADRITFTYPLLNAARQVVVLIGGAGKADMLDAVLTGSDDAETLPIQGVRPTTGDLVWLVDRAAARRLRRIAA